MATKAALENQNTAALFSRNFASTKYRNIPREAVETVKKSILDTLGVSLAASSLAAGSKELVTLAKEQGGKKESTLLVFGGRVPAHMAALANGGLVHGLDFDDIHFEGPAHPSGVVIPAAFAVAERMAPTNGKDFITAVALGQDMVMRITSAVHGDVVLDEWLPFPTIGVFAAAASSAKLLKLDERKIHMAIGIALAYSAGAMEIARGNLRGLYDSWAAMGGVLSALMAQKGITGPVNPLEGERGLYAVYFKGKCDKEVSVADLGKVFQGMYIGYKPWPSCACTHPSIDATLGLVRENDLSPDDIAEITVSVGKHALANCEPLEYMRRPKTIMDTKFSIPFVVALACVSRNVTLGDFTQKGIRNPAVLKLTQRVTHRLDPALTAAQGLDPSIVEIRTRSGKLLSRRSDFVYGHFRNPMTMEAVIDKFKDCAGYSAKPISQARLNKVVDMVLQLEKVADVGDIIRLLG